MLYLNIFYVNFSLKMWIKNNLRLQRRLSIRDEYIYTHIYFYSYISIFISTKDIINNIFKNHKHNAFVKCNIMNIVKNIVVLVITIIIFQLLNFLPKIKN